MIKEDCTHKTVDKLEKELLFNEVMRLRRRHVDACLLLEEVIDIDEISPRSKEEVITKIKQFVKWKDTAEGIHS